MGINRVERMLLIQHLYTFFNKFLLNFENLQKDVYKQSVREYTYTVIKKILRRSKNMIVINKLMSLDITTSMTTKITHSTRLEWIA